MNLPKFSKDQIKKLALSAMGFVVLLYVYFTFFLGPLQRARDSTLAQIDQMQKKIDGSKGELAKPPTARAQPMTRATGCAAPNDVSRAGAPSPGSPPRGKPF